jgi:hypothetical protein
MSKVKLVLFQELFKVGLRIIILDVSIILASLWFTFFQLSELLASPLNDKNCWSIENQLHHWQLLVAVNKFKLN